MRWNPAEASEIVEAAAKAPVYSADRPWALELHGRSVYLFETGERSAHDPLGFDRLISCGAALEHVVLAIRHAGWHAHVVFPTDQASSDVLAVVRADRRQPPDPQDVDLHRAIRLADASGGGDAHAFGWASHWAGTELRALSDHELVVITIDDRRPDHLRGGAALQAAVLAGRSAGVAVRPVVHLVHRQQWRAGLIERHELAGFPQALAIVAALGPVGTGPSTASAARSDS